MADDVVSEPFSIESAEECAERLFSLLSKTKQREELGTLNELLVVLSKMPSDLRGKSLA